ncbi:hypothetical protein ACXPVS_25420 [Pseudomonas sp. Ma2-10]
MNEEPVRPVLVGARYRMDGRVYEVINVTNGLVSFKDIEGRRTQHICPDDLQFLLHRKEIILSQRAPLDISPAVLMLNSNDPAIVAAKRKHFYVMGINKIFMGVLPKKDCERELEALRKLQGDTRTPSFSALWKWTQVCKAANWKPWSLIKKKSKLSRGKFTSIETLEIIDRYINEVYLSDQKHSVAYVYFLIKGEIYNNNRLRRENNAATIHLPSQSTVRRRVSKLCGLLKDTKRLGIHAGLKNNKSSSRWAEPTYLLELCGIDCKTPLDIILVDAAGAPLGKIAHLQAMIEVASRKIIAYDLSATPPCAEKTLRTLRMALQEASGEELQRGKPHHIIGDNGPENYNDTVITILDALSIQHTFIPIKTPDANAHIERFYNTLNSFVHSLPGTTFSNPTHRGGYDSLAKACLTMEDLQAKFSLWLEGVYHQTVHSELNMTPNAKWDQLMAKQLPPEKMSETELNEILRGVKHRAINGGRITFFNLQWRGPGLAELKHKLKPKQKAIAYYDISDLGKILVAHPEDPTVLIPAEAANPAYQNGLTLYEHNLVCKRLREQKLTYSDEIACCTLLDIHRDIAEKKEQFKTNQKKSKPKLKPKLSTSQDKRKTAARIVAPRAADEDNPPSPKSPPLNGYYLE